MADALAELITRYQYPGEQPWVRPAYDGGSVINLMASLLAHFGLKHGAPLAFHPEFASLLAGKRKIVLLLLDGMGWYNIAAARARQPVIGQVFDTARCWPLTTISPSTTSAALSSVMTALPPAQHGIIGFLQYFPQYQHIFNMLSFQTPTGKHDDLLSYGFSPENYYQHQTVLQRLANAGVMVSAFTYQQYLNSGLSRLIYHGGYPHPYQAIGDLVDLCVTALRSPLAQCHFLYWSTLDTLGHTYGGFSPAYARELAMLATVIRDQLLPCLDAETALLIIADHGHIDGDDREAINISAIPGLLDLLRAPAAGEGRGMHLFLAPGKEEYARVLLAEAGPLEILTKARYLEMGLLGPLPLRPGLEAAVGDLVLFPHGSRRAQFDYEPRPHSAMIGRHGGLSPEEMVVPLLVWA